MLYALSRSLSRLTVGELLEVDSSDVYLSRSGLGTVPIVAGSGRF